MERFCSRCGSLVSGDVKFCPLCGEPMKGAVDLGKEDRMPYVQPNYENQPADHSTYGYSAPQYGRNIVPNNIPSETMTTSQWFGTIIVCSCLGIISMIMNIIWGYSSTTPEPKRSFCRAMLIFNIVGYAFAVTIGGIAISLVHSPF